MRKYTLRHVMLLGFVLTTIFTACKKDKNRPEDPVDDETNVKQTPTTDRRALTNDSLFLYAKQIYYWNTTLPGYDAYEPRKYTSKGNDLANYDDNLLNIARAAEAPEYVAAGPYLKYSYIEDIATRNPNALVAKPNSSASVDLEGNGNDLGIRPIIYTTSNTNNEYLLFITAVYPGSDADKKGMERGWAIKKINGQAIGANYQTEASIVENGMNASTVRLEGIKYLGSAQVGTFDVTISKTVYKSSPVLTSSVIDFGGKKIGYLAYARFSNTANSVAALNEAFSEFASAGISGLVIDLRYNGGGYVSTAEHLVNLIAPSTASGVMYKEYFNETLRNGKATIMKNQPILDDNEKVQYSSNGRIINYFDDVDYSVAENTNYFRKAGEVKNVTNVVFLVTGNTASASELVINSLKPKMNVKLVGERTYGKPIGFFPIRLENKYDVYYSLFETKNALDQGGYFEGMVPDFEETATSALFDDPRYDFGDKNEPYLATALSVFGSSAASSSRSSASVMSVNGKRVSFNSDNEIKPVKGHSEFVGMIEDRVRRKK
ncbi:S41 family peptidase [Pedobacter deserti]|uniref:S41 family peptidase n=1 Tax=Pedobacter deserti TaxID=2817382 RepID=UPI002108FD46|nr:S41 family peptidase [Pedobacter sp. SYSU D00382]